MILRATLVVVLSIGWISSAQAGSPGENVQTLYVNHCADCHESDGRGSEYRSSGISIPDFSSKEWMQGRTATQLKLSILLGKGEEMPPFEGEISEAETVALVRLVRAMAGLTEASVPSRSEFDRELAQLNREWERLRTQWNLVFAL